MDKFWTRYGQIPVMNTSQSPKISEAGRDIRILSQLGGSMSSSRRTLDIQELVRRQQESAFKSAQVYSLPYNLSTLDLYSYHSFCMEDLKSRPDV